MFHAGGHKGVNTRGRSSGLSRNYPHFLSHVDWKAPLRCGILFCTFSCILFVIGVILTWLGVHDVFGESVPITGPILLAVGGLMLLLALRQFYMAHVRKKAHRKAIENKELGDAAVTGTEEHDEENQFLPDHQKDDADVEGCRLTDDGTEDSEKPPLISGGFYDSNAVASSCADPHMGGSYMWPPVAFQHPYYSMAMMVYKDPTLAYALYSSASGPSETCSTGAVIAAGVGAHLTRENSLAAAGESPLTPPPTGQCSTAVLEASSTTLQQQANANLCTAQTSTSGTRQEASKIFPADYLASYKRVGSAPTSARAGISNLPNPTAFMMLRTLELQETI